MGLFKKFEVGGKKISPGKVTDLAIRAVDSIALTGFTSTEELYRLLTVNCMGSDVILDEALKELARTYNDRAAKESEALHSTLSSFVGMKESHVTNIVLMDDKLKMIADVRSYIAMQKLSEKETKELPLKHEDAEELLDVDPAAVISSIAAAVPDSAKGITMLNKQKREG